MTWPSILAGCFPSVLGRGDGDELFYVIAVLILSGIGALADRIKKSKERSKRDWKPTPVERPDRAEPAGRTARPAKPSAPSLGPFGEHAEKAPLPRRRPTAATRERQVTLPPKPRGRGQTQPAPPAARRRSRRPVPPRTPPAAPTPSQAPPAERPALRPMAKAQAAKAARGELSGFTETRMESSLARDVDEMSGLMSGLGFDEPRRSSRAGSLWLFGPSGRLTAADLRRYIVLSEVFQPPLALREN